MTVKIELANWAEFQQLSKQDLIEWDWDRNSDGNTQYQVFGRFASRWSLAANLKSILLEGSDPRTQRGYLAGMRVALSYSALEHLLNHSIHRDGKGINKVQIPNPALADALRQQLKTYRVKQSETVSDPAIRKKLADWESGAEADVLIVARALRHMFAHGSFTPYGVGVITESSRQALQDLSMAVRLDAESRFIHWLRSHTRIP